MSKKLYEMINSEGLLDLFDFPFVSDDLEHLEFTCAQQSATPPTTDASNPCQLVTGFRFGHTLVDSVSAGRISDVLRCPGCTIERIQFVNNGIGQSGVMILAEALKDNKSLRNFEIVDDDVAVDGSRALAEMLRRNQYLSTLTLQNNSITTGSAVDCLSDSLRVNTTLQLLDLCDNDVGDLGAAALARVLGLNRSSLTALHLGNCNLGAKGVSDLAIMLRDNRSLQHMRLQFNCPGEDGMRAMAEALSRNRFLLSLTLSHCALTDSQCSSLPESLNRNHALSVLDLDNNSLTDRFAGKLLVSLKDNLCMSRLSLQANAVSQEALRRMSNTLRKNCNEAKIK